MENNVVVGLGEILWDIFPTGKVLGGAPANFAFHINSLGMSGIPLSAVGNDKLGKEIISTLSNRSLNTEYLQINPKFDSGTVEVTLDESGIPTYVIMENVAWDNIEFSSDFKDMAEKCKAACFGSLAQRNDVSRATILKFLEGCNEDCLKVFDINLRQNYFNQSIIVESLHDTTILKLNDDELYVVSDILGIYGSQESLLSQILENYDLNLIALTKGEYGSLVVLPDQESFQKPNKIEIIDTVGAGDAFTAGLVFGLLNGLDLDKTHSIANNLASYVCSKAGATPNLDEELKKRIINI